jgi:hypothetical protein
MALGIGPEAYEGHGRATLERFVDGTEHNVFEAKDADEIHNFFKFVTMSVVTRRLSQNPNAIPKDGALRPPNSSAPPADGAPADPAEIGVAPSTPATAPGASGDDEDSYW